MPFYYIILHILNPKILKATKQIIERDCSCLTNAVLVESLKITKFAMLSRATSGIRKKSLIINLAGSKKGSQVSFMLNIKIIHIFVYVIC